MKSRFDYLSPCLQNYFMGSWWGHMGSIWGHIIYFILPHFNDPISHNYLKNKRQRVFYYNLALCFADWTGLEPATPCVTGMYSNQLNYQSFYLKKRRKGIVFL